MVKAAIGSALLLALAVVCAQAQAPAGAPPLTFEVASIKQIKVGSGKKVGEEAPLGIGGVLTPLGNRFRARNITVRKLVRFAYGHWNNEVRLTRSLEEQRVIGGPSWIDADAFDIDATMPEGRPPDSSSRMLRALLEQRFGLSARRETRDMPVYALAFSKRDRTLGGRLRARVERCVPEQARCGLRIGQGSLAGNEVTIAGLAAALSPLVGRVVVDRTGLDGVYDFEIRFTPAAPIPASGASPSNDAPSIFTAVQEQLGLKLESARAPVEMIVIESVQHPSVN